MSVTIKLPNGMEVTGDNPREVAEVARHLTAPNATQETSRGNAHDVLHPRKNPEITDAIKRSTIALELLERHTSMKGRELARELGLSHARGLSGVRTGIDRLLAPHGMSANDVLSITSDRHGSTWHAKAKLPQIRAELAKSNGKA